MKRKFKNKVSQHFYDYFMRRIRSKEITWDDLKDAYGKDKQLMWNIFYTIRVGRQSVNVEQLIIAKKKLKAPVGEWF